MIRRIHIIWAFSQRLAAHAQVDRAVFFSLLTRVWQLLAGPVTLIIISTRFTLEYQGYYNTFISIAGYTTFAMLGLAPVIVQFASHEWAHLSFSPHTGISGDPDAYARIASLARMVRAWFLIAGLLIFILLSSLGSWFFYRSADAAPLAVWMPPWILMIFLCSIDFTTIPYFFLLQGCGCVKSVYTYKFIQGIIAHTTIWTAALAGARLYTYVFFYLANILSAGVFLLIIHRKRLYALYARTVSTVVFKWRDVLPMQWRVAVVSLSSYFMFQLFTQTSMFFSGPARAAQMGNTWNSIIILGTIMSAFLGPKMPQLGMYAARKEFAFFDRLFFRSYAVAAALLVAAGAVLWSIIFALNTYELPYFAYFAERFLTPLPTALFLIAYIIFALYNGVGNYMIAFKKLPYFWVIMLATALTAVSIWYVGPRYGVVGAGIALICTQLCVTPLMWLVWHRTKMQLMQN